MSTEGKYGRNYAWERVRYLTRTLANHSMRRKAAFEPGDIACCYGSIERAFCLHLKDLDIALEPWEHEKGFEQPYRFCVINNRFENGHYEVFLMTTFGQARTFDELGPIAQKYGIPVGGMNWFEDIDPIQTYPASFGWEKRSFIFAIPSLVKAVMPAAMRWTVRLVPGELERLREISHAKMMNTCRVHRFVRRSLKHRHYKFGPSSVDDEQDDFLPTEEDMIEIEHDDRPLPTPVSPRRVLKVHRYRLPIRHDLFWLLNYASNRIYNYSTYLDQRGIHRKGPIQLRLGPVTGRQHPPAIPKAYYSPYLRINIRAISRMLR